MVLGEVRMVFVPVSSTSWNSEVFFVCIMSSFVFFRISAPETK